MAIYSKRRMAKLALAAAVAAAVTFFGLILISGSGDINMQNAESEATRLAGRCSLNAGKSESASAEHRSYSRPWHLCLEGPYFPETPCFVFSFGDGHEWQFEKRLAVHLKCQVLVFSPYMPPSYMSVNDRNPYYLREGLHSPGRPDATSWFTASYLGHLKRFNAESLVIDILKIDMSGNSALHAVATAAKDGSLKTVKQLLLSVLASWVMPTELTADQLRLVGLLRQNGFHLWRETFTEAGYKQFETEPRFNLHFINSKFAQARGAAQPGRNPQGSELRDPLGRLPIVKLPAGYSFLSEIQRINLNSLSYDQLEQLYYQAMEKRHVHCPHVRRIGDTADGGWDVCFSAPLDIRRRRPCVAFSFGIENVYYYDDVLADDYNCKVYMFDPSMGIADHRRRKTSWFFNTGLSSNNTVELNGWKMRTLCTLFNELGYSDGEIDILKIDVEFWEWASLEKAVEEGCLKRVRQLMFETHTGGLFMQESDYARFIRILRGIYGLGFAAWHTSLNVNSVYYLSKPCCHEHYLINTNLMADFSVT